MSGTPLVALLAISVGLPQQPPGSATPAQRSAIQYISPPIALPRSLRDSVRFGWFEVPQDHGDSAAGTLRLAFSVLPARDVSPEPDPIVFIPGGPGLGAVEPWTAEAARSPRIGLLRERRDFIILDPRGHGLSQPHTCPELNDAVPLTDDSPAAEAILGGNLRACRARLEAEGIRLATLNAMQAAHDIELLRRALGVDRINLLGASYGTRIAAEALRQHGGSIRAVVLLGPVPPGLPHLGDDAEVASEVFPVLFRRCKQLPECSAAYPHLEGDYTSLIARVRRKPLNLSLPESARLPDGVLRIDEVRLKEGLAGLLVSRDVASGAPMLIHTLARHGFDAAVTATPHLLRMLRDDDVAFGTNLAFHCNDSPVPAETVTWLRTRCPPWVGEEYGDRGSEPLRSDVPALIMVGEFDPRTPPSYARHLAGGLANSRLVEIPWHGHHLHHPCISRIQRDFFDTPGTAPRTTCLDSLPALRFPAGVVPSRWVASAAMRAAGDPLQLALAGVPAVLLLAALIGLPMNALHGRKRHLIEGGIERVLLWATAATALTLLIATSVAIRVGGRQTLLLPAIGVPSGWSWVLGLPWLLLALTAIVMALMVRGFEQADRPSMLMRVSAVAGAGLVLALWAYLSVA